MERIVLFLVLGAFLTGSMYAYNIQRNATDADAALWSYQYQELARDAALAGLDRTVAALARDAHAPWPSPSTYSASSTAHGSGFYEVSVQSVGGSTDTVDVYVTGINGPDTMRIDARYRRAPDDHETPPPFRTVLLADDLTLDGDDIVVRSNALNRNASIHVNETLNLDQFDLDVHGYGTFTTPGSDEFDVADFLPDIDYNGAEPNVLQIPEIPVPDAHMDWALASLFRTGDFVQISIKDEGYGVREKERERVFAPFQRARQPQIISEFGYGLALYLCKHEVEAMNGKLWFDSEEKVGSTFSVKLPAWREDTTEPSAATKTQEASASG